MADDISTILTKIGSESQNVEQLTKSLEKLSKAKKEALKAGDISAVTAINKMEKAYNKLIVTAEKYKAAQDDLQKSQAEGKELTDEQTESLASLEKEYQSASKVVKGYERTASESFEKIRRKVEETKEETVKYWKAHSVSGKVFGAVSSGITKLAASLSASNLLMMAWNRHVQAAELRQNILIKSYRGLDAAATKTGSGIFSSLGYMYDSGKAIGHVTKESLSMSEAIVHAEATAQKMGVSTEAATKSMERFAYITGVRSPETLGKLAEGAVTVSRAMGIEVSEAVDFVALRMDKFGGSAAGALLSLNRIRENTEDVNNAFGRTVVRADDVVKTLSDISRQTNMYAIDQRFVGNILRDNIARLQAAGDSYDSAQKKATAYTKAITGQAPEWMQVYAGVDIMGQLMKGFDGERVTDELGAELEAAKPGLRKEIEKIMGDKTMGYYSKMRLVQEMTSGTTLGVEAMNKQIMKLASNPQGVVLIARQFGVSLAEAQGMVDQAKKAQQETAKLNNYTRMNAKDLAKSLNISEQTAQTLIDSNDTEAKRKEAIKTIMELNEKNAAVEADARKKAEQSAFNKKRLGEIQKESKFWQDELKRVEATGDKKGMEIAKAQIMRLEEEKSRYEAKEAETSTTTEGLTKLGEVTSGLVKSFEGYAVNTGNWFKAMATSMSSTVTLLAGAVVLPLIWNRLGVLNDIEKKLAEILVMGRGMSKGGGVGGIGGSGTGGMDGLGDLLNDNMDKLGKKSEKSQDGSLKETTSKKTWRERLGFRKKDAETTLEKPAKKGLFSRFRRKGVSDAPSSQISEIGNASENIKEVGQKMSGTGAKFVKGLQMSGAAISMAQNLFGDSLKMSSKDLKSLDNSWVGTSNKFAQQMAMVGGPVGELAGVYMAGVEIGKMVNVGLDKLGLTSEVVGQKMMDLAEEDGPIGATMRAMNRLAGGDEIKTKSELKQDMLAKDSPQRKAIERSASKWGMSAEEWLDAQEKASEKHMKIAQYLESTGKKRIDQTPSFPEAKAKQQVLAQKPVLQKETKSPTAPIAPSTATALKLGVPGMPVTEAVKRQAASEQSTDSDAFREYVAKEQATTTTPSTEGMPGSFVGGIGGDGSVTLKIDNFMSYMAKASGKMKSGMRQPG